jgi:hypothetical protein
MEEYGEKIVDRRAVRYSSEDIHQALFEKVPEPRTLKDIKQGIPRYIEARHARGWARPEGA